MLPSNNNCNAVNCQNRRKNCLYKLFFGLHYQSSLDASTIEEIACEIVSIFLLLYG